ncbi:MAG: DUF1073 domain-containing protein [Okeania sp. SIO4D6]|nr:DUF1073 domain-containing protein [Okeania sp. SIO4D6]
MYPSELINIAKLSTKSMYGHQLWNIGNYSIEDDLAFNDVNLSPNELEIIYRNSNLISKVIDYFPTEAEHYGYRLINNDGVTIEDKNNYLAKAFKEASISARLYGKSFLVFNPEKNEPLSSNIEDNDYQIYQTLSKVSKNTWMTKEYKKITFDSQLNKKVEYIKKSFPDENVFVFVGKRTYDTKSDIDDENYSDSVIKGLMTQYKNYIISSEFGRKILQNLSNLTISVKGLSLQLKSKDMRNRIAERLSLLDQNRSTANAILHDENEKVDYVRQNLDNVSDFITNLRGILLAYSDIPEEKLFGYNQGSGYWTHIIIRQLWAEDIQTWIMNNWIENLYKFYSQINPNYTKIIVPLNITLTDLEKAEVEEKAANRSAKLVQSGIITTQEARSAYRLTDFTLNIALED